MFCVGRFRILQIYKGSPKLTLVFSCLLCFFFSQVNILKGYQREYAYLCFILFNLYISSDYSHMIPERLFREPHKFFDMDSKGAGYLFTEGP